MRTRHCATVRMGNSMCVPYKAYFLNEINCVKILLFYYSIYFTGYCLSRPLYAQFCISNPTGLHLYRDIEHSTDSFVQLLYNHIRHSYTMCPVCVNKVKKSASWHWICVSVCLSLICRMDRCVDDSIPLKKGWEREGDRQSIVVGWLPSLQGWWEE